MPNLVCDLHTRCCGRARRGDCSLAFIRVDEQGICGTERVNRKLGWRTEHWGRCLGSLGSRANGVTDQLCDLGKCLHLSEPEISPFDSMILLLWSHCVHSVCCNSSVSRVGLDPWFPNHLPWGTVSPPYSMLLLDIQHDPQSQVLICVRSPVSTRCA